MRIDGRIYRKAYQGVIGFKWNTSDFDIHHLNQDRTDNRISNLVLLPRALHRKYHLYASMSMKYIGTILEARINCSNNFDASVKREKKRLGVPLNALRSFISLRKQIWFFIKIKQLLIGYRNEGATESELKQFFLDAVKDWENNAK